MTEILQLPGAPWVYHKEGDFELYSLCIVFLILTIMLFINLYSQKKYFKKSINNHLSKISDTLLKIETEANTPNNQYKTELLTQIKEIKESYKLSDKAEK